MVSLTRSSMSSRCELLPSLDTACAAVVGRQCVAAHQNAHHDTVEWQCKSSEQLPHPDCAFISPYNQPPALPHTPTYPPPTCTASFIVSPSTCRHSIVRWAPIFQAAPCFSPLFLPVADSRASAVVLEERPTILLQRDR